MSSIAEPANAVQDHAHLNGHASSNGYHLNGTAPSIPTVENPETALLSVMAQHPHTIKPVCLQHDALTRAHFHDPVAGCIFGAFACEAKEPGMPVASDVRARLESWADDPAFDDEQRALALEAASLFPALSESAPPGVTQQNAKQVALKLASQVREQAPKPKSKPEKKKAKAEKKPKSEKSQADFLFDIARREATVFCNEKGEGFATVIRNGTSFTYPLGSTAFRSWLSMRHHELTGRVASNSGAIQAAITTLIGFSSGQEPAEVFLRVAPSKSVVYYDLGDSTGRVVEITARGWSVLPSSPVPFLRPKGMLPQVAPKRGGSLAPLRELVNIGDGDDFILYVSWLLAFFRPFGPPPHLGLLGEQGTGKTATTVNSRRLLDPNAASTRKEPKEPRDLSVAAKNNALIGFDNLSHLPSWLSDFLCCLSTGAGFATRALYADDEEAIFSFRRPVIFNAITEVATRPDLLDRTILLELPSLSEAQRREERTQEIVFEQHAPLIMGVLFDAVATGLQNLPNTRLEKLPRMADFATWAAACAPALGWTADEFIKAYSGNREEAQSVASELSTLANVIEAWAEKKTGLFFTGTPQELFEKLGQRASFQQKHSRDWPNDAKSLGYTLRRLAPPLRAQGINAEQNRSNGKRSWTLTKTSADPSADPSADLRH